VSRESKSGPRAESVSPTDEFVLGIERTIKSVFDAERKNKVGREAAVRGDAE